MNNTFSKYLTALLSMMCISSLAQAQTIHRLDAGTINSTALTSHIHKLMDTADVTGLGIIIFNNK